MQRPPSHSFNNQLIGESCSGIKSLIHKMRSNIKSGYELLPHQLGGDRDMPHQLGGDRDMHSANPGQCSCLSLLHIPNLNVLMAHTDNNGTLEIHTTSRGLTCRYRKLCC